MDVEKPAHEPDTVKLRLEILDSYCQPYDCEIFEWNLKLSERLRLLSLSYYDDLQSYYLDVTNIQGLHKRIGVELPESFYVSAFLTGLPAKELWDWFKIDLMNERVRSRGFDEKNVFPPLYEVFTRAEKCLLDSGLPSTYPPEPDDTYDGVDLHGVLRFGPNVMTVELARCSHCKKAFPCSIGLF